MNRNLLVAAIAAAFAGVSLFLAAQTAVAQSQKPPTITREGSMTLDKMGAIIMRLDENAKQLRPGVWDFTIEAFRVQIYTSLPANRMRIMVRIKSAEALSEKELLRIAQANLDTALDARYAVGSGVLWSAFIHPLSSLHQDQFIEAVGSTVNLALSYGTTYSSGLLSFGLGDSRGIIRRELIDRLLKKGQPI